MSKEKVKAYTYARVSTAMQIDGIKTKENLNEVK